MDRVITKVQTNSRELNQAQENVIRVLNPILPLMVIIPAAAISASKRPTPAAGNYLSIVRVRDQGQPERIQICLQNSDGSYGWADFATAPL